MQDKVLTSWDNAIRQNLISLSCADFYLAAVNERFHDATTQEDIETLSFLRTIGRVLSSLTQTNAFLSAAILQHRRQACLDMTKLDTSLEHHLMAQPWSAAKLFDIKIAETLKAQQTLDTASANQRLIQVCSALRRGTKRQH